MGLFAPFTLPQRLNCRAVYYKFLTVSPGVPHFCGAPGFLYPYSYLYPYLRYAPTTSVWAGAKMVFPYFSEMACSLSAT